jgi:hypothetical protein
VLEINIRMLNVMKRLVLFRFPVDFNGLSHLCIFLQLSVLVVQVQLGNDLPDGIAEIANVSNALIICW